MTLLLVDDDRDVRQTTRMCLEMLGETNLQVIDVGSAQEALEVLRTQPVDIVTSDILMPGMNGFTLLQRIREAYVNLPVVMLSGSFNDAERHKAAALGASGFLAKPFQPSELLELVTQIGKPQKPASH